MRYVKDKILQVRNYGDKAMETKGREGVIALLLGEIKADSAACVYSLRRLFVETLNFELLLLAMTIVR